MAKPEKLRWRSRRSTHRLRSSIVRTAKSSARMAEIRRAGTSLELVVRDYLSSMGAHYRVRNSDLPGSPDVANRRHCWAIFVHGCFWHGHKDCKLATLPKSNRPFWRAKIRENRMRDSIRSAELRKRAFRVATVWGCEISRDGGLRQAVKNRLVRIIRPTGP